MSNYVGFHAQLASIMEALTKAAVAEICDLVDDGYAVLRLEISRSQKENESLKRKLQMMEMRVARERAKKNREKRGAIDGHGRLNDVLVCDELTLTKKSLPYDEEPRIRVWGDGESSAVDPGAAPLKSRTKPADQETCCPETIVIKEETLDEHTDDSDLEEERRVTGKIELCSDAESRNSVVSDSHIINTGVAEQVLERHTATQIACEDIEMDALLKAEPDAINETLQLGDLECSPGAIQATGRDYVLQQRANQLQTIFAQAESRREMDDPVCSYSKKTGSDDQMGHPELEVVSTAAKGTSSTLSPFESPDESEVVVKETMMSMPDVEQGDMCNTWSKDTLVGHVYTPHIHYKEYEDRLGLQSDILTNMCLPLSQATLRKNTTEPEPEIHNFTTTEAGKAQRKVTAREKRFICGYCGKCFTCPKYLQTHQRVHTGEKPYTCLQCGKRFAQSGYLKKHQNVHTGAKPFGCKQCGKRFADSSNLIRHRSVHTGEKPFICTYCGERFAGKHNLKIHQQRNHPALWSAR